MPNVPWGGPCPGWEWWLWAVPVLKQRFRLLVPGSLSSGGWLSLHLHEILLVIDLPSQWDSRYPRTRVLQMGQTARLLTLRRGLSFDSLLAQGEFLGILWERKHCARSLSTWGFIPMHHHSLCSRPQFPALQDGDNWYYSHPLSPGWGRSQC